MAVRKIRVIPSPPLSPLGRIISLVAVVVFLSSSLYAQSFLHTDDKNIVDGSGNNIILKGIGTGNWMLQEGYMMKTGDVAGIRP